MYWPMCLCVCVCRCWVTQYVWVRALTAQGEQKAYILDVWREDDLLQKSLQVSFERTHLCLISHVQFLASRNTQGRGEKWRTEQKKKLFKESKDWEVREEQIKQRGRDGEMRNELLIWRPSEAFFTKLFCWLTFAHSKKFSKPNWYVRKCVW